VPERSWVQSLLPTTEVEPGFFTFGGMPVPVLQLISPVCNTGTSLYQIREIDVHIGFEGNGLPPIITSTITVLSTRIIVQVRTTVVIDIASNFHSE
jgi:hypothetical protein